MVDGPDVMDGLDGWTKGWDADPDWMIQCDCCQEIFNVGQMVAEEGDRWECFACWDRLNAKEREEAKAYEQSRNCDGGAGPRTGPVSPDGVSFLRGRDEQGT